MKKFFALLAVGLVMMTTAIDSAEAARRMGGGMSLGRPAPALRQATPAPQAPAMRQNQQRNRQNAAQQQNAAGAAANAAKPSMMRNILMGAAAALGITALLSALGLSEGVGQIIMARPDGGGALLRPAHGARLSLQGRAAGRPCRCGNPSDLYAQPAA